MEARLVDGSGTAPERGSASGDGTRAVVFGTFRRMRRRVPSVLVLLASVAVATATADRAAIAEPVATLPGLVGGAPRAISPGVEVFEVSRQEPMLRGRVARIAPEVVRQRLRLVVSNDQIAEASGARRERTTSMCRRYRCVVGVNADQWYISGADPSTPIGGTVVEGELWRTPEADPNPYISMGQLQFDVNGVGDARPAPAGWTTTLESADGDVAFELAVNRIPLDGEVALYTHRLATTTPVDEGVTEWSVAIGDVREGVTTLHATSGESTGGGNTLAPAGGVLAVRGAEMAEKIGALLSGTALVRVEMGGAYWANGGFPVLFENGEYSILPDDPANHKRAARTVAGWTAAGELLLVTADSRPGWSAGLSTVEAAQLLRSLGAVEAINLDGGGSTTFVEGGRLANRPSDGTSEPVERAVVDALVIIPPEGLDFATATPRTPGTACPDGQVPPPPFDDLAGAAIHAQAIACAAGKSIASGTRVRVYDPTGEVSRGQMATFLERLLLAAGVGVPGEAPDAYGDDETSVHQTAINRLAAMGIVTGVGDGRYEPEGRVTRAQMGTFLARAVAAAFGGAMPPAEHDYFVDDSTDLHEANINLIAELGIAGGVSTEDYNPAGRVSRAQMASFLVRALDAALTG